MRLLADNPRMTQRGLAGRVGLTSHFLRRKLPLSVRIDVVSFFHSKSQRGAVSETKVGRYSEEFEEQAEYEALRPEIKLIRAEAEPDAWRSPSTTRFPSECCHRFVEHGGCRIVVRGKQQRVLFCATPTAMMRSNCTRSRSAARTLLVTSLP